MTEAALFDTGPPRARRPAILPDRKEHLMPQPMRLALIAPPTTVPPSSLGGLDMVRTLADGLAERGHHVTLIGGALGALRPARYVVVDTDPGDPGADGELVDDLHAVGAGKALEALDVQAVSDHTAGYAPASDRRLPTVRTVYRPASAVPAVAAPPAPGGLVAVSRHQRRHALGLGGLGRCWLDVIAPGIPFAQHPLSMAHDGPCLYLGPLLPGHQVEVAVAAAHQTGRPITVADTHPTDETRVWAEVRLRPLLGHDDQLLEQPSPQQRGELLQTACCLVAPLPYQTAFSLEVVQALAAGTPVAGLIETVAAEQVLHATSGWLARTPADLPRAIGQAAGLEPRRARAQAARRFDAEVMVANYEAVLSLLVHGRHG